MAAEVGSTANRYQIFARLAVGGMAELYLVRGASVAGVERYCVLKRILRERASDEQFVRMFVDEARLAAQLQHPNIASVYDVGMLGDSYFFTMEYVHGETVRSLLQRAHQATRQLPLACVLTIIAGAAAGLHHAHERHSNDGRPLGIVHRDVSPSNLMVSFEGNTKLVDFGVAKAANRAIETQSGTVKGKISYLSPEQCRGTLVDRRSDIFSLGIVMWEMLTGARLYRRPNDFENMTAIVHEPPPPPSSRRPDLPRAIDDIVMKMLAKPLDARYQTAHEVIEAIENASMRAGTLLSGSAVARLMRDLFGTRPEPWLALDLSTVPHDATTMLAEPVPADTGLDPVAAVESELASVPDMTTSNEIDVATEQLRVGILASAVSPLPGSTTDRAPLATDRMPLATQPIEALAKLDPKLWVTTMRYPKGLPIPPRKAAPVVTTAPAEVAASSAMPFDPREVKGSPNSTLLGVGGSAASGTGARPAISGPSAAAMAGHAAVFSPSTRLPPPQLPVVLAHPPQAAHATGSLVMPSDLATSSDLIPLHDSLTRTSTPSLRPGIGKPLLVFIAVAIAVGVAIAVLASRREPALTPSPPVLPVDPPVVRMEPVKPPPPPATPPAVSKLRAAYDAQDYAAAFAACKQVPAVSAADVAQLCVMAACYRRDGVVARHWLASVRAADSKALEADCKRVGNLTLGR